MVEVLLNHGADRTLKNDYYRTPLQEAEYHDMDMPYNQYTVGLMSVISLLEEQR